LLHSIVLKCCGFFFSFFFYYSYVHTRLGSFVPRGGGRGGGGPRRGGRPPGGEMNQALYAHMNNKRKMKKIKNKK
jgi:hypothetical protein